MTRRGSGPDKAVELLYIVGTGRCGTTFLDVMLGQQPGFWTVGELHLLQVWIDEAYDCGCNQPVANCDFWADVRRGLPADAIEEMGRLRREPRPRGKALRWNFILGDAARRLAPSYGAANVAILRAINAAASQRKPGELTLVDASKDIYRLQMLIAGTTPDEVRIRAIHVWRDPEGFVSNVADRKKLGPRYQSGPLKFLNIVRYALRWRIENRLFLKSMKMLPAHDRVVINFDDLVRDWTENAVALCQSLGSAVEPKKFAHTRFDVNHGISGNSPRWSQMEPRAPREPDFLGRMGEATVRLICGSTRDMLAARTRWSRS